MNYIGIFGTNIFKVVKAAWRRPMGQKLGIWSDFFSLLNVHFYPYSSLHLWIISKGPGPKKWLEAHVGIFQPPIKDFFLILTKFNFDDSILTLLSYFFDIPKFTITKKKGFKNFGIKSLSLGKIPSRSMGDICKCKLFFWTLHNTFFLKLYLECLKLSSGPHWSQQIIFSPWLGLQNCFFRCIFKPPEVRNSSEHFSHITFLIFS